MSTQIVYAAHTPSRVLDELNAHATQTRIRLEERCPACDGEIKDTHNDVRCDACEAPVSFFQQRLLSDDADTRVIYIQVNRHEKEIHRLDLCCLSCEERLNAEELCPNTCEIQTFLTIETDDDKLYVKRWLSGISIKTTDPRQRYRFVKHSNTEQWRTCHKEVTQSTRHLRRRPYDLNTLNRLFHQSHAIQWNPRPTEPRQKKMSFRHRHAQTRKKTSRDKFSYFYPKMVPRCAPRR